MEVLRSLNARLGLLSMLLLSFSTLGQVSQDPFQRVSESRDVQWLEQVAGSLSTARQLQPAGGLGRDYKDLRTAAYARLGSLGTPESLAAVKRIEAIEAIPAPELVPLGVSTHPCFHFSDCEIKPFAQAKGNDGNTYAILTSSILGDCDLFLVHTKTPEDISSWSRPKLIPNRFYPGIRAPKLRVSDSGVLLFSFIQENPGPRSLMEGTHDPGPKPQAIGPQQWKLSPKEIEKDSDKDGWTDVEEKRLGLNPSQADSDGDAIPDGRDVCPDYAASPGDDKSEDAQILQRAVFASFGLTGSRYLLIVENDSRRAQLCGYGGPIIYNQNRGKWSRQHPDGAVYVSWRITVTGDEAFVGISDYEGELADGSQYLTLRKINNEWFVTARRIGPVS
jgi:hypothetical protein